MPPVDDIPPSEVVTLPPLLDAGPFVPLLDEAEAVLDEAELDEAEAVLDEPETVLDAPEVLLDRPAVVLVAAVPSGSALPGAGSPLSVPHAATNTLKNRAPADAPLWIPTQAGQANPLASPK